MSKKINASFERILEISSIVSSVPVKTTPDPNAGISNTTYGTKGRKTPAPAFSDTSYLRKRITKEIIVPASAVNNNGELNIVAATFNQDGEQVTTRTFNISHEDQVAEFKSPVKKPTIEISKDFQGVNIISITQNDPFADKIRLAYRPIDPDRDKYHRFTTIKDYKIPFGKSIQIEHKAADANIPAAYRAIPSTQGIFSHIFAEAKMKPTKCDSESLLCSHYSCVINARPVGTGIEVKVSNITGSPAYGYICRREASNFQDTHDQIFYVSAPGNGAGAQYVDTAVEEGVTYEYTFKYYSITGESKVSKDSALIEFIKPEPSISSTVKKRASASGRVSFDLSASIKRDPGSEIQKNLLGASESENTEKDQSESDLLIFKIERINLLDGSVKDLGYHLPGQFSDRISKNSFNPAGYRYRFEVFFKERSALEDEIAETVSSGAGRSIPTYFESSLLGDFNVVNQDKKSRYSRREKFFNRSAIKEGTLCYGDAARSNRAASIIERGRTGVVKFIDVPQSFSRPAITNLRTRINNQKHVVLTWGVKGSNAAIDHFLIMASFSSSGRAALVGVCHHVSNGGTYSFTHKALKGHLGNVRYTVTPIYIDFKRGEPLTKAVNVWGRK